MSLYLLTDEIVKNCKITNENKINFYDAVSTVLERFFDTNEDIKKSFDRTGIIDSVSYVIDTFKKSINDMKYLSSVNEFDTCISRIFHSNSNIPHKIPVLNLNDEYNKVIFLFDIISNYRETYLTFDDMNIIMNFITVQYLCIYKDKFTILLYYNCYHNLWINGIKTLVSTAEFNNIKISQIYNKFYLNFERFLILCELKQIDTKLSKDKRLDNQVNEQFQHIEKQITSQYEKIMVNVNNQIHISDNNLSKFCLVTDEQYEKINLHIDNLNQINIKLSQQNQDILDILNKYVNIQNDILSFDENDTKIRIYYIYRYIIALTVLFLVIIMF